MKIYSIKNLALLLCILLLAACKEDNRQPDAIKGSLPKLTIDESADFLIQDETFEGKVIVDLLFKDYPKDANVVIRKNGDNEMVKVLKENVTTFPQTVTVNTTILTDLYGEPMESGDYVEIGMDVLLDNGLWVPAFNEYGLGSSPQADQLPGSNPIVKFKAVCPLNLDAFIGTAEFEDGFWEETYDVTVERKSENVLLIKGIIEQEAPYGVLELTVDPAKHTVSAERMDYAPVLEGLSYKDYVLSSIQGELNSCESAIEFSGTMTCNVGSFGTSSFSLKMK